jgi:endoglucanase
MRSRQIILRVTAALLMLSNPFERVCAAERWPLWTSYKARFLSDGGRIIDPDLGDRTTSEGQAYALFFSLVADDRDDFHHILSWTEQTLTKGGLSKSLPAWLWAKDGKGSWQVPDWNAASDADLWLAYTLIEAGRLWKEPVLRATGISLAGHIFQEEVVDISGLGTMLLPGPQGFRRQPSTYLLNPSYLPVQLLLALSGQIPDGPWEAIASATPQVVRSSAPKGFEMDWMAYRPGSGFMTQPAPTAPPLASYDAIRVYLWAGMLDPQTPHRKELLDAAPGMLRYLRTHGQPPAEVTEDGVVKDPNGSAGFSAALLPYLDSLNESGLRAKQERRLRSEWDPATGLYGRPLHYYDQNLALFGTGWMEKRFSFDRYGNLSVAW